VVRFARLVESFETHLRGRQMAPKTISTYIRAARSLSAWLEEEKGITAADEVDRAALEMYFAQMAENGGRGGTGRKPGGVSVDYRALQQFFKWADEGEEEITPNPMARMRPPVVPDPETPVLREAQVDRLLKVCEGRDLMSRRDAAMISLLLDTGIRLAELANLKLEDVNVPQREAYVMGKGRRARVAPFGYATATAIDRYLRSRDSHRWAERDGLWLGDRSAVMTSDGIDQMIRRRGREAGIPELHAHMLRHTWAHNSKKVLHDDELMRLAGWKSRQMIARYAASTADERARESGKKFAYLDRRKAK
jgi:integrase/recombinase XerC